MYEITDVRIIDGVASADAVTAFTEGDCWALAIAVHKMTGWPLVLAGTDSASDLDGYSHVMVRMPDGLLLDITGASTVEEVEATWGPTLETTLDAFWYNDDGSELMWVDEATVHAVAEALVALY